MRGPQRKEREFLKVGLREKRADLSFPVSPTRGRIRCGTDLAFGLDGNFPKFYLPKSKAKSHTSLGFLALPGDQTVFPSSVFEVSGLFFPTAE